jgi:glutamate dehydrogenase (NAD(P)+)
MFVTKEILERMGVPVRGTRIAVQGMGNVGLTAAKLLYDLGCVIVAVSDVSGGLYKESGLDMKAISQYFKADRSRMLNGYNEEGAKRITNEELLTCDAYVLIPAALENQINERNAKDIKAKIIVEGANGPTTVEADKILESMGVVVVPDILANAGGVVVSYFEWVQNIQSLTWDEEEINGSLGKIMIRAFNEVWDKAAEKNTTLRMGAYMVALDRVVKAKKIRGVFP